MKLFKKLKNITVLATIALLTANCNSDNGEGEYDDIPVSPVVLDLARVPYDRLSEYQFFQGDLKNQEPSFKVIPYEPSSALFTDYASKKRFLWVPNSTKIEFDGGANIFKFPIAAALIKTFYYETMLPANAPKILETRLMIKTGVDAEGDDVWIFANYVWNEDQTEAYLDNNGQDVAINFTNEYNQTLSSQYRIPSQVECHTCHKMGQKSIPIGPKPQNLDFTFAYETSNQNQLDYFISNGILDNNFDRNYPKTINWKDTSQDLNLRVRSYVDANCAHCHRENSHCSYRTLRFAFNESQTDSNLGICVQPEEIIGNDLNHIVSAGRAEKSVLFARMNTNNESIKMPILGRNLIDTKAVEMVQNWINNQTQICN